MDILLLIIGIVSLGFVVNVALKQSYNFLFFLGGKPIWWITTMALVAITVWALSAITGWGVSVPAWACTIAFFMNLPPGQGNAEEKRSVQAMTDETYAEMGDFSIDLVSRCSLSRAWLLGSRSTGRYAPVETVGESLKASSNEAQLSFIDKMAR